MFILSPELPPPDTKGQNYSYSKGHYERGFALPIMEDYQPPEETSKNMILSLPRHDLDNIPIGGGHLLNFLSAWKFTADVRRLSRRLSLRIRKYPSKSNPTKRPITSKAYQHWQ